jgi:hypothetical protein
MIDSRIYAVFELKKHKMFSSPSTSWSTTTMSYLSPEVSAAIIPSMHMVFAFSIIDSRYGHGV